MNRPLPARRRDAPGASPLQQQQDFNSNQFNGQDQPSFDTSYANWGTADGVNDLNGSGYLNNSGLDTGLGYDPSFNTSAGFGTVGVPNSQLVRRQQNNQQLISRNQNSWQDPGGGMGNGEEYEKVDEEEDLERRAREAKKEAQAKRKSIPPFVQKLSSFLDDNTNTDLIRWSDSGRSFIVLDEDEFARKLIPELFKHNNYASFVRQLNMYGFHKKVGLSDNSMKASENKRKTPSEYSHIYFRRGKPDLLWLIQKPKNPAPGKRKRDERDGGDSDDERKLTPQPESRPSAGPRQPSTDVAVLGRSELNSLRQELAGLQKKQTMITQVIQQMKQQNQQLATAFSEQHQRHENSINAILTFLATFYNRSLEGQTNMSELFNNQPLPHGNVQAGNIVDMGDVNTEEMRMPMRRQRQPLLLPAPEVRADATTPFSPATVQTRSTVSPRIRNASGPRSMQSHTSSPLPPNAPTPPVKREADSPQGMMSVINAANSASPKTAPGFDFNSALDDLQNGGGNTPLTHQQRNDMLSLMQASMTTPPVGDTNGLAQGQDPVMPPLDQIAQNNEHLDLLQQLQSQQGQEVQQLQNRIHSLSPLGYVPELEMNQPPDFNLDFDPWIDNNAYDPNASGFDFEGLSDEFSNGGVQDEDGVRAEFQSPHGAAGEDEFQAGGQIESLSSRATTASPREKMVGEGDVSSPRKKRRGP